MCSFVTQKFRKEVFHITHNLAHPVSESAIKTIITERSCGQVKADKANWVKFCVPCQESKIEKHTKTPIDNIEIHEKRFKHIAIDLTGLLLSSKNYRYCLTCIDRFRKWSETIPLHDIAAASNANASHHG